jgi:hypothetical protein
MPAKPSWLLAIPEMQIQKIFMGLNERPTAAIVKMKLSVWLFFIAGGKR